MQRLRNYFQGIAGVVKCLLEIKGIGRRSVIMDVFKACESIAPGRRFVILDPPGHVGRPLGRTKPLLPLLQCLKVNAGISKPSYRLEVAPNGERGGIGKGGVRVFPEEARCFTDSPITGVTSHLAHAGRRMSNESRVDCAEAKTRAPGPRNPEPLAPQAIHAAGQRSKRRLG